MAGNLKKILLAGLALSLVAPASWGQQYSRFGPVTGVLKGNVNSPQTSAATSADIGGLWTGCTPTTLFLRDNGACSLVNLASDVTGTLPVANGGTGRATLASHGVLLGAGTGGLNNVAPMAADTVLQGAGASIDPAAATLVNCGSSTQALSYSTSTHTFGCQTISGGGGVTQTTGSFTMTLSSGCTTTPTSTAFYTKTGNAVTLRWTTTYSCTGNSTTVTLSGLPAAIQPATGQSAVSGIAADTGGNKFTFFSVCNSSSSGCTAGNMSLVNAAGPWAGSGSFVISQQNITYSLD